MNLTFDLCYYCIFIFCIFSKKSEGALKQGKIVFQDEFNGNSLNTSLWDYDESCSEIFGPRNLQCYTRGDRNIKVEDGHLKIIAKMENYEDKRYTSGRIRQLGLGYTYGSFVVRAKFPRGKHLWSSIWLQPEFNKCLFQQINIVEHRGQDLNNVEMSALYGKKKDSSLYNGIARDFKGLDLTEDFHEYAIFWLPSKIHYYIDNVKIHTTNFYFGKSANWTKHESYQEPCLGLQPPFNERFRFIINLAVGGEYFDGLNDLTFMEARRWEDPVLEIDWVKIYQLTDESFDGDDLGDTSEESDAVKKESDESDEEEEDEKRKK